MYCKMYQVLQYLNRGILVCPNTENYTSREGSDLQCQLEAWTGLTILVVCQYKIYDFKLKDIGDLMTEFNWHKFDNLNKFLI